MLAKLLSAPPRHRLVLGLVVAALVLGMFLPVYSDEIGWRFQERAGFDGVDKMFADTCGPNTLARPPFFMWPARYYSWLFNSLFPSPLWIRLSGVLYALAMVGLFLRLIARLDLPAIQRNALVVIALGTLGLGLEPLLLVWSRPEQPILLAVLGVLLIAGQGARDAGATARSSAWWRAGGITLAAMIACSYHVKGVILLPVMLAALWCGIRGPVGAAARWLGATAVTIMALWAYSYWAHRLQCPDDPVLAALYARHNLGLSALKDHTPVGLIEAVGNNLQIYYYLLAAAPTTDPMSFWLPDDQVTPGQVTIWGVLLCGAWGATAAPALVLLARGSWRLLRHRAGDWMMSMALCLVGATLAWCATQSVRNVYECAFVLPMLMLAIVLVLASAARENLWLAGTRRVAHALSAVLPLSLGAVAIDYGPALARAAAQSGYVEGQANSISVFGFDRVRRDVLGAARRCGIGAHGRPGNLLLDEASYLPLMQSAMPQFRIGVLGPWGVSIDDVGDYLRSRRSDGVVVACHWLDNDMLQQARRQGEFCCIDPANL